MAGAESAPLAYRYWVARDGGTNFLRDSSSTSLNEATNASSALDVDGNDTCVDDASAEDDPE